MVLLNANFDQEVVKDPNGNYIYISLEITVQNKNKTFANTYRPNENKPQFYNDLKQIIDEFKNDNSIYAKINIHHSQIRSV